MTAISPSMIVCAFLLLANAITLLGTGHSVLVTIDLAAVIYLIWNSVVNLGPPPPPVGPKNPLLGA